MSGKEKTKGSLALAAPRVITIPANDPEISRKLRVAAYARVSSNSEDQAHSFAAQNAYFSKLIAGNPNWELADIYADKGITGTSIDKREDFLRMMEDCRKGRVDRILVKSISRFGRNTKESLEAVRELAGLGVSVLFEDRYGREHRRDAYRHLRNAGAEGKRIHLREDAVELPDADAVGNVPAFLDAIRIQHQR